MLGLDVERLLLKEGNPMSLVFQNIDHRPPLRPASVYPLPFWGEGGGDKEYKHKHAVHFCCMASCIQSQNQSL